MRRSFYREDKSIILCKSTLQHGSVKTTFKSDLTYFDSASGCKLLDVMSKESWRSEGKGETSGLKN